MRNKRIVAAFAASSVLAGCGGDGGVQGPGSTPAAPSANSTITSLVASQSFTNDDAVTTVALAPPGGASSGASASKSTLSISYDASSKSYTVSTGGRSQTFAPGDQTTSNSNGPGITAFQKSANGTSDYLTLVTTPFDTSVSNRYVGLGFWQRNLTTRYALTGTSSFNVDFSSQSFTGALALKGKQEGTGASRDFGSFVVTANILYGQSGGGPLTQGGASVGNFTGSFFGPGGEEFAGTFSTNGGGVMMAGVVAAKAR